MISHIYINGVRVDNEKTFIQKIGNTSGAVVDFSQYQRGGVSGQILSRPLYQGISINMAWSVSGSSVDDFIAQRDRLIGYFQNLDTDSAYTKTLGIELSNGVIKEIPVLFTAISSDLEPSDILHDEFSLTAVSEKEYFTSRTAKSVTMGVLSLGGMAIPTPIPTSLTNNPKGDVTVLINSGNASAYPTLTVNGIFNSGFTLTNLSNSKIFQYDGTIANGHQVIIDFYNRTAIHDGATNVLAGVSGDWVTLRPGTNEIYISGASNDTGTATITYKDTYRNI